MPYDMPLASQRTSSGVRAGPQVMHGPGRGPLAGRRTEWRRAAPTTPTPVEPMLYVYQERVETFRLIAATVPRCVGALVRWFAS